MEFKIQMSSTQKTQSSSTNNNSDIEQLKKDLRKKGIYKVGTSSSEKGLFRIAQSFGMSLNPFKDLVGLSKDSLNAGQELKNIPHKEITGSIKAFAKSIGIDPEKNKVAFQALLDLNGIKNPDKYKPQKGEHLYIFPKGSKFYQGTDQAQAPAPSAPAPAPKPTPKPEPAPQEKIENEPPKPIFEDKTPKEPEKTLAEQLEEVADKYRGAVGRDEFNSLFNKLDKKNIIEVWDDYKEKFDNSLLFLISDEWSSNPADRKKAITKVFDLVSEATKNNSEETKEEFLEELNHQFDSWGRVSTQKLDTIINTMINPEFTEIESKEAKPEIQKQEEGYKHVNSHPSHFSGKAYANEVFKTTNGGNSKDITVNTVTSIKSKNGHYFTAGQLKNGAIAGAKNDKGFDKVETPFIMRPLPNYNTETKKIEAVTEILYPQSNGNLNGKLIILNPGHGGYQQNNGLFDPGTVLSVKNKEGKEMPIEEWRVTQSYTEKLADQLRDRGATVVVVSGAVQNGGMSKQGYIEKMLRGQKGADEIRDLMKSTNRSDMLFLSIHVESNKNQPNNKSCSVKYTKQMDKELANNIQKHVAKGFTSLTPDVGYKKLYVNSATKDMPSSLVEIGNIANSEITNSLLSNYDQNKYMLCIADAIEETLLN